MVRWGQVIPADAAIEGVNERCIEAPLGLAVMQVQQPGWVLDAGCAMNARLPEGGQAQIVHLTQNIQSEKGYLSDGKRSYVCGDLRNLRLFAARAFDRTVCVSTLEHVGFDNSCYSAATECDPESMFDAVHELCRVTDRVLLLTVPYSDGKYACDKWRYLTTADLGAITQIANSYGLRVETRYYGKTAQGWYGGTGDPVEASRDGFPQSVNAIAAMRCVRE